MRYRPAFAVEIVFCGKSQFLWEASVFAVKPAFCPLPPSRWYRSCETAQDLQGGVGGIINLSASIAHGA